LIRKDASAIIYPDAPPKPSPAEAESLDVWGFRDTHFDFSENGHIIIRGSRYELSGKELPRFLPWVREVLVCDVIETRDGKVVRELGTKVVLVKKPEQLDEIDGLVIPGGESGTFLNLLGEAGFEKLKQFVRVKPTFGTCAGAILLANEVENPRQEGLGALDIRIRRNAYGRQIDSSIRTGKLGDSPLEMVFIRAPKIEHVGPGVEVVATEGNDPVAVRQGRVMASTFHPELSDDTRVHRAFLDLVRNGH